VERYNPAHTQRFDDAQNDLVASFGKAFVPVLRAGTAVVRAFADAAAAVSGPAQRLMATFFEPIEKAMPKLVEMATPLLKEFGRFADELARSLKPLAESGLEAALTGTAQAIGYLTAQFRLLTAWMGPQIKLFADFNAAHMRGMTQVMRFSGGGLYTRHAGRGDKSLVGGSVGMGVRNVQLGSVESFHEQALKNAFAVGGANRPEDRTAANTERTANYLEQLVRLVANFKLPGEKTADDAEAATRDAIKWGEAKARGVEGEARAGARAVVNWWERNFGG
jgi:hypothetical protein